MPEITSRSTLEAGGLLPVGSPLPGDLPTDTVDARGYTHPCIAGRVVVRLVPDAIARGIDTEMELLGFGLGVHADDIAVQRRRALGFPGATLVQDPDRARYALDVMREFKRHAKRIASKPGHAKEGFDEIADRLQRQVPHFLPSYWEEVARAFASGGNLTYAAQAFDRARTAEREFGLTVDEERRGEAFLEFALLGALTVKALQSYGKELSQTAGPKAAYERMFSLATRRTLGGVAPWASMPKDLRTLVKAAKLDARAEEERLLRELLPASSLKRAPAGFWSEYRDTLVAMGRSDPAIRSRLLDLFPNGGKASWAWSRDESGFSDTWMSLLAEAGALEALWDADAPEAALPSGGRAAWLERLQEWVHHGDGWILQIVRKAAPLLVGGPPVTVRFGDYYRPLDLDLVDLLLELRIPYVLNPGARVDLARWAVCQPCEARFGLPAEVRPRDPIHAATDPTIARFLGPAIDAVFGNAAFESVAAGMKGLATLRRQWLIDRLDDLDGAGLATTLLSLARLEAATTADHFAEFPDAVGPLDRASIAAALARTLRLGIFEELRWPAWHQVVAALGMVKEDNLHMHVQFPHLLLADRRKLYVLGPGGVELEHDLKHGQGDAQPAGTLFVGGSALVAWSYWTSGGSQQVAYWTHAPNQTWPCQPNWIRGSATPIEVDDAVVYGVTRVARGDQIEHTPQVLPQAHDATGAWVGADQDIFAQDRRTGARGAPSRPAFLAEAHWSSSDWWYTPVNAPDSPMGVVEGQYGWRWIRPPESQGAIVDEDDETVTTLTLQTLAGDRYVGPVRVGQGSHMPTAMVRWPGAERARPMAESSQYWRRRHDTEVYVADPDDPRVTLIRSQALKMSTDLLPPLAYWHFAKPTDLAGSLRLRRTSDDDAARLLEAARGSETDVAALTRAIAAVLPEVTVPELQAGLAHVLGLAVNAQGRLEKLREARKGGKVHRTEAADLADEALVPSVANLRHYWMWGGAASSLAAARTLGRFLAEGETGETIVFSRLDLPTWLGRIRAVAWCAARPGLTDENRKSFARFARGWATSGLAEPGPCRRGQVRIETIAEWVACQEGTRTPASSWRHHKDDRRVFTWEVSADDDAESGPWSGQFVERGPSGPLEGATVSDVRSWDPAGDAAWLERFADLLEQRGARVPDPAAMERVAESCGMSRTEAALVLEGMPSELDKATREAYGLKHAEVKAVANRLYSLGVDAKLELLGAMLGDDPESVWSPDLEGLARAWRARFGRTIAVDEALIAVAARELRHGAQLVKWFANPSSWEALAQDKAWKLNSQGLPETEGAGFDADVVAMVVQGACWLATRLPVGHPLRSEIPTVVALARQRCAHPNLWIAGLSAYLYEDKLKKAVQTWFDALPTQAEVVVKNPDGSDGYVRKTLGPVVVTTGGWRVNVAWQHAGLDPSARELIGGITRLTGQEVDALRAFDLLSSEPFDAMVKRLTDTPVREGGWEQDPTVSAPEVVAEVAKAEGLSPEGATLWLQLMTLLDPTKKACIEWNGWTPKTYAAAAAELVGKGLVVEGKRARAGRDHFLPGGWVEAKDILPYEEWKRPLYGWEPRTERFPLRGPLAAEPLHRTFARAWKRCVDGDRPRFEEVRR